MGTKRTSRTARLEDRLVLLRFVCGEFGYDGLDEMFGRLRPARGEIAPGGESDYLEALAPLPAVAAVAPDRLAEYDAAILDCSRRLRMTGEDGRTWKPTSTSPCCSPSTTCGAGSTTPRRCAPT